MSKTRLCACFSSQNHTLTSSSWHLNSGFALEQSELPTVNMSATCLATEQANTPKGHQKRTLLLFMPPCSHFMLFFQCVGAQTQHRAQHGMHGRVPCFSIVSQESVAFAFVVGVTPIAGLWSAVPRAAVKVCVGSTV